MKLATLISATLHLLLMLLLLWLGYQFPSRVAYTQVYSVNLVEILPETMVEPETIPEQLFEELDEPVGPQEELPEEEKNDAKEDKLSETVKVEKDVVPQIENEVMRETEPPKAVEEKKSAEEKKVPKVEEDKIEEAVQDESIQDITNIGQIRLEGEEFEFPYYLNLILHKIRSRWQNPHTSRVDALSVTVFFRILKSGQIINPEVDTTSGSSFFDRAAIRAITTSDPLPPLPGEFAGDNLGVHLEFIYEPPRK